MGESSTRQELFLKKGFKEFSNTQSNRDKMLAPRGNYWRIFVVFGLLSVLVNFPEGYSNSYPNTSHKSFRHMINGSYIERGMEDGISEGTFTWFWSFILNVWFVGYLFGTFCTPYITERFGRKNSLQLSNVLALFGAVISFISVVLSVPELFLISRLVSSYSSGISFGALILFLQEATPTHLRGFTSFLSEVAFIMTTLTGVGFGMNFIFGNDLPMLAGTSIIPAVLSIIITMPLHDTPKFLLINRNDREAALKAIQYYHGESEENEKVLDEMSLEITKDEERMPIMQGIVEVFRTKHLRTAMLIGILALQTVCSLWPILYLSTDILEANFDSDTAQMASFLFVACDFVAAAFGMGIIERFGRRPLLLTFGVLNTLSLGLYCLFDQLSKYDDESFKYGCIVALCLFGVTYGMALGPIAFFITSELVSQRYRSLVQSIVFATNTIMNFAISFITLPIYNHFGSWGFIPLFIVPSILSLLYLYKRMPETHNREIHDIVDELRDGEKKKLSDSYPSYSATNIVDPTSPVKC